MITNLNGETVKRKPNPAMANLPVRACSIYCLDNPEWGTFGVMEDRGGHYEIQGKAGRRVLDKWEACLFWAVEK